MIDPHGEYSAAFKSCGELFNVDNLQLPYWLMNFEEHCEVFLTTARRRAPARRRHPRQVPARRAHQGQGRRASIGKVTVDSPDPLPARPTSPTIIVNEMGKLDRAGDTLAVPAAQDQARRASRRSALHLHVLGHAGRRIRWPASSPSCSACRATASRSRSSTSRASRPKSPRSWSRCSPAWCSTMRSGRGPRRSARCCSSAKRRTATSPRTKNAERPGGPQDPRADRQGRP